MKLKLTSFGLTSDKTERSCGHWIKRHYALKSQIQPFGFYCADTYVNIDAIFRLGFHFPLTVGHFKLKAHVINRNGVLPSEVLTRSYREIKYRCLDHSTHHFPQLSKWVSMRITWKNFDYLFAWLVLIGRLSHFRAR